MADAHALGACVQVTWRFKSSHPHQSVYKGCLRCQPTIIFGSSTNAYTRPQIILVSYHPYPCKHSGVRLTVYHRHLRCQPANFIQVVLSIANVGEK